MTEKKTAPRGRVLVVEDEDYVRRSLVAILAARGFDASEAASVAEATEVLARSPVDVVLSDLRMPGADGLELVRRLQERDPELPIVILTGHGTVASAVQCLRAGASDYVLKPAEPEALEVIIERAMSSRSLRREVRYLRSTMSQGAIVPIGSSEPWKQVMSKVDASATTDSTVLLVGESGTGKELLARRIHELSPRASGPFVKVNCAAVPVEMWESEFFGHRKGAFTGADSDREGRFQLADRGTLLLDEIGAMPAAGQAKLLRVIQDGEFDRLGDAGPTRVDVRIVASTNSDVEAAVQKGQLPRGSLLSAERPRYRSSAPPGATRGHPAPRRAFRFPHLGGSREAGACRPRRDTGETSRLLMAGKRPRASERPRTRPHPLSRPRGRTPPAGPSPRWRLGDQGGGGTGPQSENRALSPRARPHPGGAAARRILPQGRRPTAWRRSPQLELLPA